MQFATLQLPFAVFDRGDMPWAATANPKLGASVAKAVQLAKPRANGRIDACMN